MMKIYISGRISGLNREEVVRAFERVKEKLLEEGHIPVNPLENGLPEHAAWEEHMKEDIGMLFSCDAIYMLKNWEESRGARIEHFIACNMGLTILFQEKE